MKSQVFLAALFLSGSAYAHLEVTPSGVATIYDARFETMPVGARLDSDHTGVSNDRPNSIDNNLTAIVQDASSIAGIPVMTSGKFVRLTESCGEAPSLSFDRAIALGTGATPTAIAHVAVDVLFENRENYHISFRNGIGSGIPGPASQTVADIDIRSDGIMALTSSGGQARIPWAVGVTIHIDAFFDTGKNQWYAFVNGERVVNGAGTLDSPVGFVGLGFDFTRFCDTPGEGGFGGAMQFDNFVFQQVAAIPQPAPSPALAGVITGVGRPYGTAIHAGYAYIADPQAHTVWKVELANPANKTPVAGIGWKTDVEPQDWQGYNGDGIESTEAQLDNPSGVAVDSQGNVYIADTGNHAIRRIGAGASFITTVAGIPTSFAVGDPARLFAPRSVAVDAAGNVYFSDMMNQQVKKLDKATGAVSVVVGVAGRTGGNDGTVAGAEFCPPFEPAGCTLAARLNSPIGVAVDSEGIVYLADEGNNRIRQVTLGGNVATLAGGVLKPTGVAVSADGGTAYIVDYGNHRVLRRTCPDGCSVTTVAGTGTPGSAGNPGDPATQIQLNSPIGVTLAGDLLYISDMMNGRIVVINLAPIQ